MTVFTVSMAGVGIRVSANYLTTKEYLRVYLSIETPVFSVTVYPEDIEFERQRIVRRDERKGICVHSYSEQYLECLSVMRKIADVLLTQDILFFHGAVIAFRDTAYMFTAPSGTGKSTHARLWLDLLPSAHILNGDKPFLKVAKDGVYACGNPCQGKENWGRNEILPLRAICILERSEDNWMEQVDKKTAFKVFLRQAYREEADMVKTVQLLNAITDRVRLYRMGCNMEKEAAQMSIRVMTGVEDFTNWKSGKHPEA